MALLYICENDTPTSVQQNYAYWTSSDFKYTTNITKC